MFNKQKEVKFCINCKFHSTVVIESLGVNHHCSKNPTHNLVTGEEHLKLCGVERWNSSLCGKKAKFFEQKF